jgi:hypothetical protein
MGKIGGFVQSVSVVSFRAFLESPSSPCIPSSSIPWPSSNHCPVSVSSILMRWRVGLQLLAIIIIRGVLWLRG